MDKITLYTHEYEYELFKKGEEFLASLIREHDDDLVFDVDEADIELFSRVEKTYKIINSGIVKFYI